MPTIWTGTTAQGDDQVIGATTPEQLAIRMVGSGLSTYSLAERLGLDVHDIRSALCGNWHLIDQAQATRIRSWVDEPATLN